MNEYEYEHKRNRIMKANQVFQLLLLSQWSILTKISNAWIQEHAQIAASSTASTSCLKIEEKVISEIESCMNNDNKHNELMVEEEEIVKELSSEDGCSKGKNIMKLIHGIASSSTFREEYWHKRALVVRSSVTKGCIESVFTREKELKLVGGSYISGHRTADVLRNGTKTNTWEFAALKEDLSRRTTLKEVEDGLQGGTIYFNTAGSLWPSLGALCRLSNAAFGLPSNINIYITPPQISLSVPPHTDKQDVFILQSAGSKHWRVYAPPSPRKENVDPLSRGKNADVLSTEELGQPLLDTVIHPGDVLYIPHGFPHTTHTAHHGSESKKPASIHLTLGLDTHVWFLTYAHVRWCLLQKTNKTFAVKLTDEDLYWKAVDTIPIGFLADKFQWKDILSNFQENKSNQEYMDYCLEKFKEVLLRLEPNRWNNAGNSIDPNNTLPSDSEIEEVIKYMITSHLQSLLKIQNEMYTNVDPHSEDTILKAYQGTQDQNVLMEQFGLFCGNVAMAQSYANMRKQREDIAAKAVASSKK